MNTFGYIFVGCTAAAALGIIIICIIGAIRDEFEEDDE